MSKVNTIGMDMGDKSHHVCVLDPQGDIVMEGRINNTNGALDTFFGAHKGAVVAMETGTHSPWISPAADLHGPPGVGGQRPSAAYDLAKRSQERPARRVDQNPNDVD